MATISSVSLYPLVQSNLPSLDSRVMMLYVRMYKRAETDYVYFRGRVGSSYSSYTSVFVGTYGLNVYIDMVVRNLRFETLDCVKLNALDSASGAPPISLDVNDGDLVVAGCEGSPSDTCILETDGGSSVAIPIVDADGDGFGVGVAVLKVSGSGSVSIMGTASRAAILDLGNYPIPTNELCIQVAEVPQHYMFVDVYKGMVACLIAIKPLNVSPYVYGGYSPVS